MSVIVVLYVDSSASHEAQENAPDVTSIRKLVLESISRSFKDILASEPMDVRYGHDGFMCKVVGYGR